MKKYILALLFMVLCLFQGLMPVSVDTQSSSHAKFACVWAGVGAAWAGASLYFHYSDFVKDHPNATFSEYFAELSNDVYENKGAIAKRAALIATLAGLIHYNRTEAPKQPEELGPQGGPLGSQGKKKLQVKRENLFEEVFGISEDSVARNPAFIPHEFDKDGFLIVTPNRGKFAGVRINCGRFKQLSIGELRAQTEGIQAAIPGSFKILEGKVDVAELETQEENNDAVFQVASRFNTCDGFKLSDYYENKTQGPTAVLPTLGGALLRHYFVYHDDESNPSTWGPSTWGQSTQRFVNLLEGLKDKIIPNVVGFVRSQNIQPLPSLRRYALPVEGDYEKITIGWHEGIDVITGPRQGEHQTLTIDSKQRISQVLTSTLQFEAREEFRRDQEKNAWEEVILNASYEGTLRAAALAGKKKVFLTLIGGGVFNNSFTSIGKAIARMKDFVVDAGLEVNIVLYGDVKPNSAEYCFRTQLRRDLKL